ncbi:MAG: PilZ domain-containing protein [Candidatus Omnitrophota bacterium]
MEDNITYKSGPRDRIYLRVPTKISATMFIDGQPSGKFVISSLSTTGLSLLAKEGSLMPDFFELAFRLPGKFRKIKICLEVKNRIKKNGAMRVGCRFLKISQKDKKVISDYIAERTEFSPASTMFSIATFLLFVDALFRVFTWMLSRYYKEAHVEYAFISFDWYFYGLTLILYSAMCFIACLYSRDIKKKRFAISLICGALAFLFILIKYAFYCGLQLWACEHLAIKGFFWIESLLVIYVGFSALFFATSQKKMEFTADTLGNHHKIFREKYI